MVYEEDTETVKAYRFLYICNNLYDLVTMKQRRIIGTLYHFKEGGNIGIIDNKTSK